MTHRALRVESQAGGRRRAPSGPRRAAEYEATGGDERARRCPPLRPHDAPGADVMEPRRLEERAHEVLRVVVRRALLHVQQGLRPPRSLRDAPRRLRPAGALARDPGLGWGKWTVMTMRTNEGGKLRPSDVPVGVHRGSLRRGHAGANLPTLIGRRRLARTFMGGTVAASGLLGACPHDARVFGGARLRLSDAR